MSDACSLFLSSHPPWESVQDLPQDLPRNLPREPEKQSGGKG